MIKNLSLTKKLLAITFISAISILFIFGVMVYSEQATEELKDARVSVAMFSKHILKLRKDEKDFLARLDLKYEDGFNKAFEALAGHTERLGVRLSSHGIDASKMDELKNILKNYYDNFSAVVAIQKKIGLNETDGLYGSLRTSVHNAEAIFNDAGDNKLLKDMLMLRRHEKDFMLRSNTKYVGKYNADFEIMMNDVSSSQILTEEDKKKGTDYLDVYKKDFLNLVDGYKEKGLTPEEGLLGTMRKTIHKTDAVLEEVTRELDQTIDSRLKKTKVTALAIVVLSICISLLSVIYISRYHPLLLSISELRPNYDHKQFKVKSLVEFDACVFHVIFPFF